jgi:hypothetical protein
LDKREAGKNDSNNSMPFKSRHRVRFMLHHLHLHPHFRPQSTSLQHARSNSRPVTNCGQKYQASAGVVVGNGVVLLRLSLKLVVFAVIDVVFAVVRVAYSTP